MHVCNHLHDHMHLTTIHSRLAATHSCRATTMQVSQQKHYCTTKGCVSQKGNHSLAPTQVLSVTNWLMCPMCKQMLVQPLTLHSNAVVYAKCIVDSIATPAVSAHACKDNVPSLCIQLQTWHNICSMMWWCTVLHVIRAGDYDSNNCHRVSVEEKQCASRVIHWILSESTKYNIIQLQTGGTVSKECAMSIYL